MVTYVFVCVDTVFLLSLILRRNSVWYSSKTDNLNMLKYEIYLFNFFLFMISR